MTELDELRARRRENKRKMRTAKGERLALRQRLDEVLAVLICKLSRRA